MTEAKFVEAADILDPNTAKEGFHNIINKGIPLTDGLLNKQSQEVIDLTSWKNSVIEEIKKAISSNTPKFETTPPPEIDYDKLTTIFASEIEKLQITKQHTQTLPEEEETKRIDQVVTKRLKKISFPNPYPKDFALIIALLVGLTSGIAIFGAIANFYLVPHAIETNRILDNQQLKFLNSSEGQFYLKLIKANSGYIDSGKCQAEAQAQKLKLTRTVGTTKTEITNVCLVKMP